MNISVDQVAQPELANHDSSVLDLAFAMDCTGSMGSYIATAQQSIRKIVEEIVSKEKSDIHLALVEYRDHPPQDSTFVTRVHDFTGSVSSMKSWLDAANATGGGDAPEAVADALHQVLKLSWRDEATKICVFIADAPPHGLATSGDGFPKGCPDGIDPIHVTTQLAEKGVTMYMVGCEPSITPYKDFFMAIAHMTGGQYVPLRNAALLAKVIIGGAQEEISLQRLMEEVNQEVMEEYRVSGGVVDEDAMTKAVSEKLKKKGAKSHQLKMNSYALGGPTTSAVRLASKSSMAEVKEDYVTNIAPTAPSSLPMATCAMSAPMGMSYTRSASKKKKKAKSPGFFGRLMGSGSTASTDELFYPVRMKRMLHL
ncbi:uncharacterized protein [Ptychodera flava]|uniref:uncharacterized protein n=1 Tax=Ptychodera flava TaxID=63121 RepID=UPI003969F07B